MKSNSPSNDSAREIAAECFLDDLEGMIVQRLHQEAVTEQGRQELVGSIGVDDAKLTDGRVKRGITADGFIALRLCSARVSRLG